MSLHTLQKVLDILFLFNKGHSALNAAEISAHLNLPQSTTYRYVAHLKSAGLLEECGLQGHYRLGLKIFELAKTLREQLSIVDVALPVMHRLRDETKETINLLRRHKNKVVCIERIESDQSLRYSLEQGRTMHMHAGASGKVVMAYLDETEQARILKEEGLPKFTPATITDISRLKRELKMIRQRGFAVSCGEIEPGVCGIAAPILAPQGKCAGGLSIVGPAARIGAKTDQFVRKVMAAADEIARQVKGLGIGFS